MDPYLLQIIILSGIHIILTASLNLINGFTGQFSLGHAGFMAVGAYASAAFSVYVGLPLGINPLLLVWMSLLAGGIASALCGFLIGLPSLRLKGDYLAIVTLGFGEIIRVVILNINAVGGARGFSGIPELAGPATVGISVLVTLVILGRLVYSPSGLAFRAVREDELASESVGVRTTRVKVTAFVTGSFFAGLAGGLFAHFLGYLNPSSFSFVKSVEIVAMVVLGGMGSLTGSVLAAVLLTALPEFLRSLSDYRMVVYSLLIIFIMILRPQGLMGYREWFLRKKAK